MAEHAREPVTGIRTEPSEVNSTTRLCQTTSPPAPPHGLTLTQWLICAIAAIGFAFDIYELLMLPLIVRPALGELVARGARHARVQRLGRACCSTSRPSAGGIFGLLGGYLTDRFGRRRVLTWSILLYAFSAFAAGLRHHI